MTEIVRDTKNTKQGHKEHDELSVTLAAIVVYSLCSLCAFRRDFFVTLHFCPINVQTTQINYHSFHYLPNTDLPNTDSL